MPRLGKDKKARIANAAAARNNVGKMDDTNEEEDVETMSRIMEPVTSTAHSPLVTELMTRRGYDTSSSTKDILQNLEKEVERQKTQDDVVHEDIKPTRNKKRYRGSLRAYDNISTDVIVQKYASTNRTGSKMYTYEVCAFHTAMSN
jgi:hypothetical protein